MFLVSEVIQIHLDIKFLIKYIEDYNFLNNYHLLLYIFLLNIIIVFNNK